ncbi:MAG: zinc-dependent metalloprotease [Phycisphaerales bacterium]
MRTRGVSATTARLLTLIAGLCIPLTAIAQGPAAPAPSGPPAATPPSPPDFPKFEEVSKDFERVATSSEGSLYTLWKRDKDGQILAELPRDFAGKRFLFAMTQSSGDEWSGLQGSDFLVYWKRYDKRLALIQPNLDVRSTGDEPSKISVSRHFTDRVILDIPIACMGPNGGPVIDLDAMLVGQANKFFGPDARNLNVALTRIVEAKAFPNNIEVAFEVPGGDGVLRIFHYSISSLPENAAYKPREADERVGYFTTHYRDLGKFGEDEKWIRYINRWHLEKAEPKLKLSPPKEPIVFYIEHTVPVRYRRFVRDGILMWNKAFEKVGLSDAIEVRIQDKASGANMDKDPEDVRYNFVRWLSNDIATAIGPSRVDPRTGQILDADIILTDGWIRVFWNQANRVLPEQAMQGFDTETMSWLRRRPQWDPRVRLAPPQEREAVMRQLAMEAALEARDQNENASVRGIGRFMRSPAAFPGAELMTGPSAAIESALDSSPDSARRWMNQMCMAASGKAMDMALMGMHLDIEGMLALDEQDAPPAGDGGDAPKADEKEKDKKKDETKKDAKPEEKFDRLDGIPDWFIGPVLADLVAHEVGHTLGLRHNFKASGIYSLEQINSEEFKGKKAYGGSVMDYNPVNINMKDGPAQGDYTMIDIGPYDFWVIEAGYTFGDTKEVLKRVAEPELIYGTDEDTSGPDPLARRYDFAQDPLDFATSRMALVKYHRERLLEKFVKDGQSWAKARRGYTMTLNEHLGAVSHMSRWVGGAFVNRDRKGDPNGRPPIQKTPVEQQRAALKFIIDNAFFDEAFGLTPEILNRLTVDKFWDAGGAPMEDATWPVHDRILGIQASAMTGLMNPATLRRVLDNEWRTPAGEDALTLPELLGAVSSAVWKEIEEKAGKRFTAREPMVSSLRRNLQREHAERLIDLAFPDGIIGAAGKTASTLATAELRALQTKLGSQLDGSGDRLDPYTAAHFAEVKLRIEKALDAQYIYNTDKIGGGGMPFFFFGEQPQSRNEGNNPSGPDGGNPYNPPRPEPETP